MKLVYLVQVKGRVFAEVKYNSEVILDGENINNNDVESMKDDEEFPSSENELDLFPQERLVLIYPGKFILCIHF